ncbi:MAG: hypothetical protein IT204_12175 [Fimbriimonadaceae bacterium]|nr:hypothetical protein [Fimbriimonadaceae bacterium]
MRKFAMALTVLALVWPAAAQGPTDGANTLWGQEGTAADGGTTINGKDPGMTLKSSSGPTTNVKNNWILQGGSEVYSAVYSWDSSAWVAEDVVGDGSLDIEADIEMYLATTVANNKIYFHLGNIYEAMTDATTRARDLTAIVNATVTSNHGMYIGFQFNGTKVASDFDFTTGRIKDAMVFTKDIAGRTTPSNPADGPSMFDIAITRKMDGGAFVPGSSFGEGAHGTITSTLWWDRSPGGHHIFEYKVELLPNAGQQDGNYILDPVMVYAPAL